MANGVRCRAASKPERLVVSVYGLLINDAPKRKHSATLCRVNSPAQLWHKYPATTGKDTCRVVAVLCAFKVKRPTVFRSTAGPNLTTKA